MSNDLSMEVSRIERENAQKSMDMINDKLRRLRGEEVEEIVELKD
jgi:hypothetical protein